MNREKIFELLKETYKQSVDDNKDDFTLMFGVVSKLCIYLLNKDILNADDIKDILNISKEEQE